MEQVLGSASIRRVGRISFPVYVLDATQPPERTFAQLGRDGWFRLYFGRGRRVELPDGKPWRIHSVETAGQLLPIVTCPDGKLAVSVSMGARSYGIHGRDFAYSLYRSEPGVLGRSAWILREHETELARFGAGGVHAERPIPLAAALLGFTLIKHGVPSDAAPSVPKLQW